MTEDWHPPLSGKVYEVKELPSGSFQIYFREHEMSGNTTHLRSDGILGIGALKAAAGKMFSVVKDERYRVTAARINGVPVFRFDHHL